MGWGVEMRKEEDEMNFLNGNFLDLVERKGTFNKGIGADFIDRAKIDGIVKVGSWERGG